MTNDSAKPIKKAESPINDARLAALEELSALDQELELKHGIKGNPMIKAQAGAAAAEGCTVTPLYRSSTLTDAEREALEIAVEYVGSAFQVEHHAEVLRALLERTK